MDKRTWTAHTGTKVLLSNRRLLSKTGFPTAGFFLSFFHGNENKGISNDVRYNLVFS